MTSLFIWLVYIRKPAEHKTSKNPDANLTEILQSSFQLQPYLTRAFPLFEQIPRAPSPPTPKYLNPFLVEHWLVKSMKVDELLKRKNR